MTVKSWDVSDKFGASVNPLTPKSQREVEKVYQRRCGTGFEPLEGKRYFKQ